MGCESDYRAYPYQVEGMEPEYFFNTGMDRIKGHDRFFLFFDFDGTLVPIQNDPCQCELHDEIKGYIKRIVQKKSAYVCIISGRSLKDIKSKIKIEGLYYGGNHGLEISGPGVRFLHPLVKPMINKIDEVYRAFHNSIRGIPGIFLENKGLSFAMHYRKAKNKDKSLARKIFNRVLLEEFHRYYFKVLKGKQVIELTPYVDWDKGKAVLYILNRINGTYLPIYIGDDLTDESAFQVLKIRGITIRIGRSKNTIADYYLKGQHEIIRFFKHICGIII